MAQIYDTGDILLNSAASGDIAQNNHSEAAADTLDSVTINDYGAKIIKIVIEVINAAAASGTLNIFSESATWDETDEDCAPVYTTGHIAAISVSALGTIDDTVRYFMNNDSTVAKKLYLAYWNSNADVCQVKVRILYESLALGT